MGGEQRADFVLQLLVAAAGAPQKDVALRRGTIERRLQQLIDVIPAFVVHSRSGRPARDTARLWRVFHSRITVIGDTCRTSAVSSTLRPPKKRSSTTLRFARCPLRQRVQGIVEGHEIIGAIGAEDGCGVERDMLGVRAALHVAAPRMVDEDAAHRLGRDGEEMGAVLPVHALVIDQPHVGFVDQRRGLQAVAGALALHVVARQAVELVVHDRCQLGERALVPVAPRTEKRTDVAREPVHQRFRRDASC